ncbi:MAG TPA: tRNA-dihydrouridine synthase [Phototrophicaceae bacterium]|nr:tRNA-dihydrouridine synthase [Phototrophicaceae bacterium]
MDYGAPIIDINMGCWVPKIANKGGGAGLLKDVGTATRVVEAVVNAVPVPVTVKVRSGWQPGEVTALPFAQAAEQVGVQAIAVHARFAKQGFQGEADWDIIRQIKELVKIPVIGNGDVTSAQAAIRMFRLTGCDGVMIGRGALGQPWIFRQIAHELRTGEPLPEPTRAERATIALEHARRTLADATCPERIVVRELRGQLSRYQLDEPGSLVIRDQLVHADRLADLERILLPIIENDTVAE